MAPKPATRFDGLLKQLIGSLPIRLPGDWFTVLSFGLPWSTSNLHKLAMFKCWKKSFKIFKTMALILKGWHMLAHDIILLLGPILCDAQQICRGRWCKKTCTTFYVISRKIHQQSSGELLNKIETTIQKKSSISPTCLKRNRFFIHERFHSLAACVQIFFWQTSHHITYVEETNSSVWPRKVIHVRGMYPLVN